MNFSLSKETFVFMRKVLTLFILLITHLSYTQDIKYVDEVYLPHIKSIKLHLGGLFTSMPVIDLNSQAKLELSFDDILGGDRNYTYRLIHCDKDWQPSDIDEMDYLDGFNDEEIIDFDYSLNTKTDYTHYRLTLPNRDVRWRISGNYLLIVKDDDSDEIAFTRRFAVVEPQISIRGEVRRPLNARKSSTHHALDFILNHKNFLIRSPQREIYVSIVQNGQWNHAQTNIQPRFVTGYDMFFDLTSDILFPAHREYRGIDLRSLRARGFGVYSLDITADDIKVTAELDENRSGLVYQAFDDLNGEYIIETLDFNQDDIRSEYMSTYFTLVAEDQILDGDVYLMGKFNDWQPREENRLLFHPERGVYHGKALLKQGYYDYQYVIRKDDGTLDADYFDGNHFATQNDYLILCYFREFGGRYDRLIGTTTFTSRF